MRKTILVTDEFEPLFILDEHIKRLEQAGLEVERVDTHGFSEDQLIAALQGKAGYLLGGIERVTDKVIAGAPDLEAISFTGSGYAEFIPGYRSALRRGVRLSAAPGVNARAVAEFTLALILAQVRELIALTVPGGKAFSTTREISELVVGVVGAGAIGESVGSLIESLGAEVRYATRDVTVNGDSFDAFLSGCNVVTLHVSLPQGEHVLDASRVASLGQNTTLVNVASPEAWDEHAVLDRARAGNLVVCADYPISGVEDLRRDGTVICSNAQTGFNTAAAVSRVSDRVTASMINMLAGRSDPDQVILGGS